MAIDALRRVVKGRWGGLSPDVEVRFVGARHVGLRAPAAGGGRRRGSRAVRPRKRGGSGVAADQRWAMEVLGLRADMEIDRDDVNRRFRRLLRDAHPDSGGAAGAAAARIAELTEARTILLDLASSEVAAEG